MQISISNLNGQNLALLLWYLDENQDQRAVLLCGVLELTDRKASIKRGKFLPPFRFPRRLLQKVKAVPEDLKDILKQCSICLQLTSGDLPYSKPEENFAALIPEYL